MTDENNFCEYYYSDECDCLTHCAHKSEPVESQEERFIPVVQVLNVNGSYAVTFTVGVQTFTLDYHPDSKKEAEWMAEQLRNALRRVKTL